MPEWLGELGRLWPWVNAAILVFAGLAIATALGRAAGRTLARTSGAPHGLLAQRAVFWLVLAVFVATALKSAGFDLSVAMGAAGVVTVAVGFASQTSASNVISGLFLLAERPFAVGDTIRMGTTQGVVTSIDLLSVKLRTFDNLFVRVPNETVMKSEITNVSRFPIRRYDLLLKVALDHPIDEIQKVLLAAADACPAALDEPRPVVIFQGYVDAGMEVQVSAWATQATFLELRNTLPAAVDEAMRDAGIALGYPRRRVETIAEVAR